MSRTTRNTAWQTVVPDGKPTYLYHRRRDYKLDTEGNFRLGWDDGALPKHFASKARRRADRHLIDRQVEEMVEQARLDRKLAAFLRFLTMGGAHEPFV